MTTYQQPDARGHFAVPDAEDLMRYEVRNLAAEKRALERLAASRFIGEYGDDLCSIVGQRNVLNFLGSEMPALRRMGWKVDLEGRVAPYMEELEVFVS